ncbi:hypothetical protein HN51_069019 [Arachis hypogaea]
MGETPAPGAVVAGAEERGVCRASSAMSGRSLLAGRGEEEKGWVLRQIPSTCNWKIKGKRGLKSPSEEEREGLT